MLKIDSHTHILPRVMPKWSEKFGYGGFIHLEVSRPGFANMMRDDHFFREIASNCWDAEERIEEYGKAGVQVQVVSTIPVMFSYWAKANHAADLARFLNDHIAQIVQDHPRHYVGLATVPMQDTEVSVVLTRMKRYGGAEKATKAIISAAGDALTRCKQVLAIDQYREKCSFWLLKRSAPMQRRTWNSSSWVSKFRTW